MLGWFILIVLFIIGIVLGAYFKFDSELIFIACVVLVIFCTFVLASSVDSKRNIAEFEQCQEVCGTDNVVSESYDVEELNLWLADVRVREKTYGVFSLYRGKIDKLEYIEINDED